MAHGQSSGPEKSGIAPEPPIYRPPKAVSIDQVKPSPNVPAFASGVSWSVEISLEIAVWPYEVATQRYTSTGAPAV